MQVFEKHKKDLNKIVDELPEEKIIELVDFAKFLFANYSTKNSQVDKNGLILQQQALKKIWDNPEEDIYEL
ncbi:MAG: DUF2281 domain-containing protein [Calditrichaeota bacterium]|nr:MAG: DUF2281 domain-containing protein [Calditrichota bacterium]